MFLQNISVVYQSNPQRMSPNHILTTHHFEKTRISLPSCTDVTKIIMVKLCDNVLQNDFKEQF